MKTNPKLKSLLILTTLVTATLGAGWYMNTSQSTSVERNLITPNQAIVDSGIDNRYNAFSSTPTIDIAGSLPQNTQIELTEFTPNGLNVENVLFAYDITLKANGEEYQPASENKEVEVTIANLNIENPEKIKLLHIKENGEAETITRAKVTENEIIFVAKSFSPYIAYEDWATIDAPVIQTQPTNKKVTIGTSVTFAISATGENLTYKWQYKPAVENGTWTNITSSEGTNFATNTLTVKALDAYNEWQYRCLVSNDTVSGEYAVQSDAATLYVLNENAFNVQYLSEIPEAPTITVQPQSQTATIETKATFTVEATGENLTYKWQYKPAVANGTWTNATNSEGTGYDTATFTTVLLTNAFDGYEYRCLVSNNPYYEDDEYTVSSDSALLLVTNPLTFNVQYLKEDYEITKQPVSQYTVTGSSATFTVGTTGDSVTYQWLYKTSGDDFAWTEVPTSMATGTTTNTLTLTKVTSEYDGYMFRCSVAGSYYKYEEGKLSDAAFLYVYDAAEVSTVSVSLEVGAAMSTEWTISGDGTEIKLPVKGTGLNVTIDWGDGSETTTWTDTTAFPTHTYETAGTYTISIVGTCPEWGYSGKSAIGETSDYYTYSQYLTGLKSWGELSATKYGFSGCANLKYVSGDYTENTFNSIKYTAYMFRGCSSLETLNLNGLDTSRVGSMEDMFSGCSSLTELDLSGFDTQSLTTMYNMFNGCTKLEKLNISNFNTSNVTWMLGVFKDCKALKEIDLSNFSTASATSMDYMFTNCSSLKELDLSTFETSNVGEMYGMFMDCSELETLILPYMDNSKVWDMRYVFRGCSKLTNIDLSKFGTSNAGKMRGMFYNCSSLTSLDLTNFNTSKVIDFNCMFQGCSGLESIDVSSFDTSAATDMTNMFDGCSSLLKLDVSNFNTSLVTGMAGMFRGCSSLTELDLSNFDTSNVTDMNNMFASCTNLKYLDLSSFNTSKVVNMAYMFAGMDAIEHLDLSSFETGGLTNTVATFSSMDSVESIDMENFDTTNVSSMNGMFMNSYNLENILISNKFVVTEGATGVFWQTSIKSVITTSTEPVLEQFKNQLPTNATLYVPNGSEEVYAEALSGDTNTISVAPILQRVGESNLEIPLGEEYTEQGYTIAGYTEEEMLAMGSGDESLYGFSVTTTGEVDTNTEGVYPLTYALTRTYESGDETVTDDMGTATREVEVVDKASYMITEWTISGDSTTITLPVSGNGLNITVDWGDGSEREKVTTSFPTHTYEKAGTYDIWIRGNCPEVGYFENATVDETGNRSDYYTFTKYLTGVKQWGRLSAKRYGFSMCSNLKYVSGDAVSDTFTNVTNMAYMFNECTSLESVDLSKFKTTAVTNMQSMFGDCWALTSLNVSSFDTSEVTNMDYMFGSCRSITSLNVSNFNTSKVTNMNYLFGYCHSLKTLNLSNFDTSNVTSMVGMFTEDKALEELYIKNFDTAKVTTMYAMFSHCEKLTKLDLSNFNTSNVNNMQYMFHCCYSLAELDLSNFDTSKVTNMQRMFFGCGRITDLDLSSFNTSNVTSMEMMFSGIAVENLDLSNFDTSKVRDMSSMFAGCTKTETIDFENADTSSATAMYKMYDNCKNLKSILISDKFVVSGDATNMFLGATNLSAIITTSPTPTANQFNGMIPETATLYVPNGSEAAYAEALSGDASVTVAPILQQNGDENIIVNLGDDYEDAGYTVAGFTADKSKYYTVYGFTVSESGDVNTYVEGTYPVTYEITRTYTSGDTAVTADFGETTRNVEVVDKASYMIMEWTISGDNTEIKLPVQGTGLNISIDWGDGSEIEYISGDLTSADFPTHTYEKAGTYDIWIRGNCPEVGYFENATVDEAGNRSDYYTFTKYLTGVKQWGRLSAKRYGFSMCSNLKYVSGDAVSDTFTNVTNMAYMFNECTSLESVDLSKFKTTAVTDMQNMFNGCSKLTSLNVSSFDTSNVKDMKYMFSGCSGITNLNLTNFNTSNVLSMSVMFENCSSLTTLNLGNFDTSNVTGMERMFNKCLNLTSLYIDKFNTQNVIFMSEMFRDCRKLTTLNVSNFNTENVTRMDNMFYGCNSLTSLDVSNFNTSKVINMNGMFIGCYNLKELDVSNFDTSNVTTMISMFAACNGLESLDLRSFDTSNVTDMSYMFSGCEVLETADLSSFETSGDTNMTEMFKNSLNLKSIQISNTFIMPEGTTDMFTGCDNLSAIITVSEAPVANQFNGMIPETATLYVPNGSEEAYAEVLSGDTDSTQIAPILQMTGDSYMILDIDDTYTENFYTVAGFTVDESEAYSVYGYSVSMSGDVDTSTIGMYNIDYALTRTYTSGDDTITTAPMSETRAVEVVDRSAYMITEWNIWDNIKTIKLPISGDANITVDWGDGSDIEFISGTFDSSNFPTHTYAENGTYDIAVKGSLEEWGHNVSRYEEIPDGDPYKTYYGYMKGVKQWGALGATRYGFSNCIYMEYVSGDATEDTFKNVTDMSYMFVNCYELKTIDLSNFDTSNVTNMEFMFGVCEALETIDLSSFDTSKVTNMKYMFGACESLETIDLSGFNTKAVTNMVSLFEGCTNLVTVKFGDKFVTNNVTDMAAMFYGCTNLKNVDLTRFDTSSVENMEYMFYKCNTLESINLSSFDTSNVKSMTAMFYDCQSLKELDLSNFNTSNVTGMYIMFGECSSLEKLDISSFDTRNVKDMYGLFAFCSSLKEIDLTSFNTENVEYTGQMFDGCTSLTYLDLTGFDTSNVVDMWSMFYDATNLESILITNKFVVPDGCDFEDMFVNTTNLNAIIITSETPMGRQFANVKDQVADKIFYVPNKSVEAYKLEFSGDISGDNIKPIIELIGDEKINLLKGNAYEEKNYTVAGFGIEEIEKYMVYGYSVEVDGTVDINTAGEYVLRYTLTRTVGAGPVSTLPNAGTGSAGAQQTGDNGTTETNVVTRTIVVYDAPIVKLYENGKKYNGNWTSNDVYAVTTILSEKTTWVAVKVGSSNWNVDPEYAEITQSGDVVTVTFKQTMNDNIYLREVDAAGHATTYETAGNMVKIDKESPVIGEVKSVTEDKVLKIKAAATDKASGVKDYAVSTKATLPAEVDFREYTEDGVVCDVANTGIYYLWVRDYANNVASGEVLATKDVEPPKGMIEIVATNILSGDGYENVIVVAPNIISGEKYTNQDVVTINILVTDNETAKERIMFALYNEEDYAEVKDGTREIEWQQFKPSVEWQLKEAQGENIIYAIFKDVAGNTSVSIKEIE